MMEDEKQQRQRQKEEQHQYHPPYSMMEDEKLQQQHQKEGQHQHHRQEDKQQQEKQNHQEEENKQEKEQQKEAAAENKQNNAVTQLPLSKRSTPQSYHSPVDSPLSSDHSSLGHDFSLPQPTSQSSDPSFQPPSVAVSGAEFVSRNQASATKVELEDQSHKVGSGGGKRLRPDLSILRRIERDKMLRKALLGFRISGFVFCLVSFSILAADKYQGWTHDSFYRYKEFRFCMAVNVIGFVYSGIQAYDLAYQLTSGKQKPLSRLRCYFDFFSDQMLAYILISASSSAAVRVDDWESNWGKDKFPEMARASMALSLLAFVTLALSSLISGYTLSNFKSM